MKTYLVRMYETYWQKYPYGYGMKNHYYEIEMEDNVVEKIDKCMVAKEKYPNLIYGESTPLKHELPKGWKRLVGTLTAPNGYYWASNGKSFFDKSFEKALIKE